MSKKQQVKMPQRRKGRGTLHVLAGLLIASAIVRGGNHSMQAYAEAVTTNMTMPNSDNKDSNEIGSSIQTPLTNSEISALLTAFRAREDRLAAREVQLVDRMQALRLAETQFGQQLAALIEAEEKLAATLALTETASENDLNRLAIVYQNMKPRDTAALFSQMNPGFAAGFLGLMQPESAAAIMTELEPEIAYSISVMLAGRNANVPRQ